jgi:hypothetical protein
MSINYAKNILTARILTIIVFFAISVYANRQTITTTSSSNTVPGSLPYVVNQIASGDTAEINISGQDTIILPNVISIVKNFVLLGTNISSGKKTIIKPARGYPQFEITGGKVAFSHLDLCGGNGFRGGSIFVGGALTRLQLTDVTITGGKAAFGGAIYDSCATLILEDCILSNDSANAGGGIYNLGGAVEIRNSTIESNNTDSSGGGVYNSALGSMKLQNSTIIRNSVYNNEKTDYVFGGGIYNRGQMDIRQSTIHDNYCLVSHTGYLNDAAKVQAQGGGIWNSGTLTLLQSTVSENGASGSANESKTYATGSEAKAIGGGIFNSNDLAIVNSTIVFNQAGAHAVTSAGAFGGGIYNSKYELTIINSTIVGNELNAKLSGGAYQGAGSMGYAEICGPCNAINTIILNTKRHSKLTGRYIRVFTNDTLPENSLECQPNVTTQQLFATDTPSLSDNGGLTLTIRLGENSIANGGGVRAGTYMVNKTFGPLARAVYKTGTNWVRIENDSLVPSGILVSPLETDQRDVTRNDPPSAGAVEPGLTSPVRLNEKRTPPISPFIRNSGKYIVLCLPANDSYTFTYTNLHGVRFTTSTKFLKAGVQRLQWPPLLAQGCYILTIATGSMTYNTPITVLNPLGSVK